MSAEDRVRWDSIYKSAQLRRAYPLPDPLLYEFVPPVDTDRVYRALDLAAGLAANGLWLAAQGYLVDVIDISRTALEIARDEMAARGLHNLNILQADLDSTDLEPEAYDIIVVARFLKRELFPHIRFATRPGGRVIYETFHTGYLTQVPGFNRAYLLESGELRRCFEGWEILFELETETTAQIAAQKPLLPVKPPPKRAAPIAAPTASTEQPSAPGTEEPPAASTEEPPAANPLDQW